MRQIIDNIIGRNSNDMDLTLRKIQSALDGLANQAGALDYNLAGNPDGVNSGSRGETCFFLSGAICYMAICISGTDWRCSQFNL